VDTQLNNEKILKIWDEVMKLSEEKAKLSLFGLIVLTEGGGHIPFFKPDGEKSEPDKKV
jgi:hypothetical protein